MHHAPCMRAALHVRGDYSGALWAHAFGVSLNEPASSTGLRMDRTTLVDTTPHRTKASLGTVAHLSVIISVKEMRYWPAVAPLCPFSTCTACSVKCVVPSVECRSSAKCVVPSV